jgi:hypothetical protein
VKVSTYKRSEGGAATFFWCRHWGFRPSLSVLELPLLAFLHISDRHFLLLGLFFQFLFKISQLLLKGVAFDLCFGDRFLLLFLGFDFFLLGLG